MQTGPSAHQRSDCTDKLLDCRCRQLHLSTLKIARKLGQGGSTCMSSFLKAAGGGGWDAAAMGTGIAAGGGAAPAQGRHHLSCGGRQWQLHWALPSMSWALPNPSSSTSWEAMCRHTCNHRSQGYSGVTWNGRCFLPAPQPTLPRQVRPNTQLYADPAPVFQV